MKAAICTEYGLPEVVKIKEVEKPSPKENEVLIKVHAATVTSGDTVLRKLTLPMYLLMAPFARLFFGVKNLRKKILGHEFAGEVEAVGKDVRRFKEGAQVFGTTGFVGGAHAEYICLPEEAVLTQKPGNTSYDEAAAIPVGGICALCFLRKGDLRSGQKILIYGASGSLGSYAVQLGRHFGALVTGVCSGANLELVKSLGAEKVIDYTKEDFTNSGEMYDFIFDAVGKCPSSHCKKVLKKNGRYVSTNSTPVKETIDDLVFIKELVEKGVLKPVIDKRYPLEQIADAHRYVDKGHKKGNVVITF